MIKIIPIASGSSGNCMYIELDGHRILIDLGVSWKACRTALQENGIVPADIEAVFITHTHNDHVKGFSVSRKNLTAAFYAGSTTCTALDIPFSGVLSYYTEKEISPGLTAAAFPTSHDCPGSCGFVLKTPTVKFGYATDLGIMTEDIRTLLTGSDAMVIESNHDEQMLRTGPYPYPLKKRILSDEGHLSNRVCAAECTYFAANGTRHFLLAHLSKENNTPQLAYQCTSDALADYNCSIHVLAPQSNEILLLE